jgi:hypothetical protein
MYRPIYKPYVSDSDTSESDYTDTDTDTDDSDDSKATFEGFQNLGALSSGLSANTSLDPNKPVTTDKPDPVLGFLDSSGGFPTFKNRILPADPSGNVIESASGSVTNVIMVDSRNRDRVAYQQPTNLTLRLPRTYTQVTGFNIVQFKLLSSFYYFRTAKGNLTIPIQEFGRTTVNAQGVTVPQVIFNNIRIGTYDINGLIAELNIQLNQTPLFYDYPGGFSDFAKKFAVTGDTSLNFNFPGDYYYDSVLNTYISNPNMLLIVLKYFDQQYANLPKYTIDNIKIAYYYPVLKEIVLNTAYGTAALNTVLVTSHLEFGETVQSRIVHTYQGFFDPVILEIINNNVPVLDAYRLQNTFRFTLINKYNVLYQSQSNRTYIQTPSLNTSLVNLLNSKAAQYLTEQLNLYSLTPAQYASLTTQNALLFAVINDMIAFYQEYLAIYFGVSYNTFGLDYLANPYLTLPLRDGYNAIGISKNLNDTLNNTTTVQETTTDILNVYKKNPPYYWNRMKNLSTTIAYMNPVLPGESGDKALNLNTWNIDLDDQDYNNQIVKPNVLDPNNPNVTTIGNLYTNRRTQFADIIIPTEAAKYTVIRFKSPVRQTLKVETLPRPTKYRYPLYNQQAYDLSHQQIFDNSYCFVENSANIFMDISSNDFNPTQIYPIPGFSTSAATASFGVSFVSSAAYWGSTTRTLSVIETRHYYEFYTPYPPAYISCNAPAYTYPMTLTLAHRDNNSIFSSQLYMFLYQDRGGFMADISGNRNENGLNHIHVASSFQNGSTVTINFTAYANKRYYILTRSGSLSFATENYIIAPSFPGESNYTALTNSLTNFDPLAEPLNNLTNYNYAQNSDPAFIKLPTASSLYGPYTIDPSLSTLMFLNPLMGYDTQGVSTDLTNYIGFISNVPQSNVVPNAILRIDPANGYIFQAKSPYDPVSQQYFYSTATNALLYPYGTNVYSTVTIPNRQTSIVHWYGNTFIGPSDNQLLFDSNSIAYNAIPPFTASYPVTSTLSGYGYIDRVDSSGNNYLGQTQYLNLGDGVCGIGFVPDQGVWDIDRFMFKSIFTNPDPTKDPNRSIQHIGIFPASYTSNRSLGEFNLSNAVAVLSLQSSITYNASTLNFGFDLVGGTYYEFVRNTNYNTGSNAYLYGYSQSAFDYNFDVNAFYTAMPFDGQSNQTYYYGIVGSPIPYPKYSQVSVVASAPSPEGPLSPSGGQSFFLPGNPLLGANTLYGPPSGYTISQSQYEQSMPIGTSLLFYANPYPINTITSPYRDWGSFTYNPTEIITDCSGYILLKDSVYRVFSYQTGVSSRSFKEITQFTLDEVFPSSSNINYLGVAANESNIAFFGLSNAQPSSVMYIRTLEPRTGAIQQTYSEVAPLDFQSTFQLFKARYNNLGGYVLSAYSQTKNTRTVVSRAFQGSSTLTTFGEQIPDPTMQYFDIAQSPKELYGCFWTFPYRTSAITDFTYVNPNILTSTPPAGKYVAPFTAFPGATPKFANIINYSLSNASPSTFISPIVIRDIAKDRVFMLSDAVPDKFFEAGLTVGSSVPVIAESVYTFPSTPTNLYSGANGASWSIIGNTLYGNRYDSVDAPKKISQMWQTFYPVQKIVFHQISKNSDPLKSLETLTYPEYPHTAIAVYDNSNNITSDTSGKWGLESSNNFNTGDFAYSGYYFNAYDYAIPIQDNRSSDDYYYMTVRNYSPTEKSQVLLRLSAANRYTFGYISPMDLSGEISTAKYVSSTSDVNYTYYWDKRYTNSILGFDSKFNIDSNGKIFGAGVIQGYAGSNISSISGFKEYYGKVRTLYNQYSTQTILTSTIQAAINTNIANFVKSDLQYIIPSYAQNRVRYTDPLRYSILWKSSLTVTYANLVESWGLGWNLGFDKIDTPYDTIQRGNSFYKITDDFLNIVLNPELDMNRMDIVLQENLATTHEPTGTTKAFFGKILLANFGSYAQTMISNPIAFANPLGKLDKFTFQLVNTDGTIVDNSDCEWNAVLQITENSLMAKPPKPVLITP